MTKKIYFVKRDQDLIESLRQSPKTSRQLMEVVGNNPPVYVKRAREIGFCISKEWVYSTNSEGRQTKHCIYSLDPECTTAPERGREVKRNQ